MADHFRMKIFIMFCCTVMLNGKDLRGQGLKWGAGSGSLGLWVTQAQNILSMKTTLIGATLPQAKQGMAALPPATKATRRFLLPWLFLKGHY